MKVALVYDRINKWGGAERVLLALHKIFPDAPLYTAVYNKKNTLWANVFPMVYVSFLKYFPFAKSHHELYPWLTPLAFESFDFDGYDLVISVTSAEAKNIITKPETFHLCYCLTPTRYLWSGYQTYYHKTGSKITEMISKIFMPFAAYCLRQSDQISSTRPDLYVAISNTVKKRIEKYYRREKVNIIFPPVDSILFHPINDINDNVLNYFLIVSRLVSYKNIDLAIRVFNKTGEKLYIAGKGNQQNYLKKLAKPNIKFLGELTDRELVSYYQNCRALIFPGEEDFGLTSIEAQACGKPVIAFNKGGVSETVIDSVTGVLYPFSSEESLGEAIKRFKKLKFSKKSCRNNALNYSFDNFKKKILEVVEKYGYKH